MKTIVRCALITTAMLILCSTSIADEQSHRKAAEDLLQASNVAATMNASIGPMLDAQIKANPSLAPFRDVMQKFLNKNLSYESIKDDLVSLYVQEFTEDELKQLAAFYQTPVGKKAIEKLPQLFAKGAQIGVSHVQANQAELKQMIEDEAKRQKEQKDVDGNK